MLNKYMWVVIIGLLFSGSASAMELTSSAFAHNQMIPAKYTCQGENISPPLLWQDIPIQTKSLVLIVDDPDATHGVWDHWIIFNIPASVTQLSENTPLPAGAKYGANSWSKMEYGGPCPPSGTHRYIFHLYALDKMLDLQAGANKQQIMQVIQGHVITKADLIGLYSKK